MARRLLFTGTPVIDTYFKQYFWTFHLFALAVAGYLCARTINVYVRHNLRAPPSETAKLGGGGPSAGARPGGSVVPTSAFLDRNVFDAEREDLEPVIEAADAQAEAQDGTVDTKHCEKTTLRLTLVATVVTKPEDRSLAVLVDPAQNEPEAYAVGEKLMNGTAEILAIEWRRVLVNHGGRCEFFSIEEGDDPSALASAVAAAPPKDEGAPPTDDKGAKLGENIKKLSESEYEIPRGEIDNVLGNLSVAATQARIVPSFQGGQPNGFKLYSIRPGSFYSKLGIQNGDIVQKINGYEINSPDKALEIYQKLKDAPGITVDLVRRGKKQTLSYAVR